jgi:hypothetical protein
VWWAEPDAQDLTLRLEAQGFDANQILLIRTNPSVDQPESLRHPIVDFFSDDTPEEFRARLFALIEFQRQTKLASLLARWTGPQDESEKIALVERAHIAHALALCHGLPPGKHEKILRESLHPAPLEEKWPGDLPLEDLLVRVAALAQSHGGDPATFRAAYRGPSQLLPYRLRSDLRAAVEQVMRAAWRGNGHVA